MRSGISARVAAGGFAAQPASVIEAAISKQPHRSTPTSTSRSAGQRDSVGVRCMQLKVAYRSVSLNRLSDREPWTRKQFFFEKKNQKTFANLASVHPERPQPKQSKVFCFFFSKKKAFLPTKTHPRVHPPSG
jgi:xanthine dehydrogenase iron-sulfur cluster and FAD-binding subunit A